MKRNFLLPTLFVLLTQYSIGQSCMSLFSYGATFETVSFINQSTVSNAHYWWNFGDGTSSYYENPIHTFPETGTYLVTLYAKDTVSNCSNYYEIWVNITKYSIDTCTTSITDSVFSYNGSDYLKIINNSTNCGGYYVDYDGGPAINFSSNNWIWLGGWQSARFISRVQYYTYNTINGYDIKREAYKTSPYNYTSSVNYEDCSANFEFSVVSEDTSGQRVLFEAMNKNALSYEWEIIGFGNPIVSNYDTVSKWYGFYSNDLWLIGLKIEEPGGCRDTLYQQILVRPGINTLVGIDDQTIAATNVQVYPNPFTNQATIAFNNSKQSNYSLTMTTLTGKVVRTINNITTGQITIDRDGLGSGIYFYQLQSDNRQVATGKLVIE